VEPAVEEEMPPPETHAVQDDATTDSELQVTASDEWSLNQQQDDTANDSEAEEEEVHEHEPEEQGMGGGRWPTRVGRPPERLICYTTELNDKPKSIKEAMKRPDWPLFEEAISKDMCSMTSKQVYIFVKPHEVPEGEKVLQSRMLLSIKRDAVGRIEKYQARLVARGDQQDEELIFEEMFAPTAVSASFHAICTVTAKHNLHIRQLGVSTAYLNADLLSDAYIRLPPEIGGEIWQLKKALYGLRQAAKQWNEKLSEVLLLLGHTQSQADPCLFYKGDARQGTHLLFHVDDALVKGSDESVKEAIRTLAGHFDIRELGDARVFLGIQIEREGLGPITLHQGGFVTRLLHAQGMADCMPKPTPISPGTILVKEVEPLKDMTSYRSIVGSLNYLAVNTRPDLSHLVSILSKFMQWPTEDHMKAAKHAIRYLKGSQDLGLVCNPSPDKDLGNGMHCTLQLYADADFAGDTESRKSTTGVLMLCCGCPVLWMSRLQSIVATSTTEAEFIAAAIGVQEALWARELMADITGSIMPFDYYGDNEATLSLIKNLTAGVSGRSKHIDVKYKFLRDRYVRGDINVQYVPTTEQLADCLTKAMTGTGVKNAREKIGLGTVVEGRNTRATP
jgi:hypothetical protein